MALTALWTGFNTYGTNIQVAKDDKDNYFWREYVWNGFGKGWSKWELYKDAVTFKKVIVNVYDFSETYLDDDDDTLLEWGFRCLNKWLNTPLPKYRLPKI